MSVERRLGELGLVLPEVMKVPDGVRLPFNWVRVVGKRATISGHGPSLPDGSVAGPFGTVGSDLSLEQGSENPANEGVTHRVLTIMLPSEY